MYDIHVMLKQISTFTYVTLTGYYCVFKNETRFSFLYFSGIYTLYNRLLGYNVMLTCQFVSQGFIMAFACHGMAVHQDL